MLDTIQLIPYAMYGVPYTIYYVTCAQRCMLRTMPGPMLHVVCGILYTNIVYKVCYTIRCSLDPRPGTELHVVCILSFLLCVFRTVRAIWH